jgi:hypothetical protein
LPADRAQGVFDDVLSIWQFRRTRLMESCLWSDPLR